MICNCMVLGLLDEAGITENRRITSIFNLFFWFSRTRMKPAIHGSVNNCFDNCSNFLFCFVINEKQFPSLKKYEIFTIVTAEQVGVWDWWSSVLQSTSADTWFREIQRFSALGWITQKICCRLRKWSLISCVTCISTDLFGTMESANMSNAIIWKNAADDFKLLSRHEHSSYLQVWYVAPMQKYNLHWQGS